MWTSHGCECASAAEPPKILSSWLACWVHLSPAGILFPVGSRFTYQFWHPQLLKSYASPMSNFRPCLIQWQSPILNDNSKTIKMRVLTVWIKLGTITSAFKPLNFCHFKGRNFPVVVKTSGIPGATHSEDSCVRVNFDFHWRFLFW